MIDPINPIHAATEVDSLWTPAAATSPNATKPADIPDPKTVSTDTLSDSQAAFKQHLAEYFRLGYLWFTMGNFEKAHYYLHWYFVHLSRAGQRYNDFGTQAYGIKRYGGLLFYSIIKEELDGLKASDAFLHKQFRQELMGSLNEVPENHRPRIHAFIHHLEETGELPTQAAIQRPITDKTISKITKLYRSLHLNNWAQRFSFYSLVQHWRAIYRLQQQVSRYQPNHQPFTFERTGLPAIPFQPAIDKSPQSHKIPHVTPYYYTHNVHRVEPIDKDPDQEKKRREREERAKKQTGHPHQTTGSSYGQPNTAEHHIDSFG